jgi:shikimate kinase
MNWSYLRHGVVIWLDVPVPVLVSRLSGDVTRPLLKDVDLTRKLEDLLAVRARLYAQADVQVAYEGRSVIKTCDRILAALQQNIRPDPKELVDQVTVSQSSINPPAKTRGAPLPKLPTKPKLAE